jgi:hypothetical protein
MSEQALSKNKSVKDPVVIDPEGFDVSEAWRRCQEYVKGCGGLYHEDGEPNWRAAFGADPGVSSCPNCGQYYWAFGKRIRCSECAFEFPPDWWPMYSYGVSDGGLVKGFREIPDADSRRRLVEGVKSRLTERMQHPYYRYGFDHPVEDAWENRTKVPWKDIMGQLECEHEFEWITQPGTVHGPAEHFHVCKHCGFENDDE